MEERRNSPTARTAIPVVAGPREPARSAILPLTGAITTIERNWAVMIIPAFAAETARN